MRRRHATCRSRRSTRIGHAFSTRSVLPMTFVEPNTFSASGLADHGDARGVVVVGGRPARARDERHVEHREEVGRRPADASSEERRRGPGAAARSPRCRRVIIAWRSAFFASSSVLARRAASSDRSAPGSVSPRSFARIELDVVELVALLRDRVGRQHVQHGQRRHARADAERDREDHQRRQRDVAAQAAPRERRGSSRSWSALGGAVACSRPATGRARDRSRRHRRCGRCAARAPRSPDRA